MNYYACRFDLTSYLKFVFGCASLYNVLYFNLVVISSSGFLVLPGYWIKKLTILFVFYNLSTENMLILTYLLPIFSGA